MKQRLIFPALARLEERKLGWFFVVTLGNQEFSFFNGEKPAIINPIVNVVLEYQVADAEPSAAPIV